MRRCTRARRHFLQACTALAGLAITAGCGMLPSPFSSPRPRRIGYLTETTGGVSGPGTLDGGGAPGFFAFRDGLRDLGYVVGENLELELRVADIGSAATYVERADELVAQRPDILVASRTAPAMALSRAARDVTDNAVPLVFVAVGGPVEIGLVESLARPGRNVTGLASFRPDLASKRLELLKASVPAVTRPAVIWNPSNADDALELAAMQAVAPRLGLLLQPVEARSPSEVTSAVDAAARSGADAIVLLSSLAGGASAAISARLPAIFSRPDAAGQYGVLLALGVDTTPMHRRAATYVHKIFTGARAADLPVEQPTAIELVVNLQTARALGITVPDSVLSQATTIIQ